MMGAAGVAAVGVVKVKVVVARVRWDVVVASSASATNSNSKLDARKPAFRNSTAGWK